jgi:hypothetical protein
MTFSKGHKDTTNQRRSTMFFVKRAILPLILYLVLKPGGLFAQVWLAADGQTDAYACLTPCSGATRPKCPTVITRSLALMSRKPLMQTLGIMSLCFTCT